MEAHTVKWFEPMSEQDMIDEFDVDIEKRQTEKLKHNARPTSMRRADWEVAQIMNYQTTIFLKRKYPELYDNIAWQINKLINPAENLKFTDRKEWENLAVITDFDAHINKLDIVRSTPKAKMRKIIDARKRILDKLLKFDPSKILMVHWWDEIETDGNGRTTKWTDVSYNMHEFDAVKFKTEQEIGRYEYLRTMMDLDVITVSGNHDELLSQMMAEIKKAYYRNTDNINFYNDWGNRAYYARGQSLLMFAHWDHVKPNKMLQLATEEFIKKRYKHKHWYIGHLHSRAQEQNGDMVVKRLSTPSMPTKREKTKGFPSKPWIQWFLHSKKQWEVLEVNEYF